MRKLWKIHIGLVIGFLVAFLSVLFLVVVSDKRFNAFIPMAVFLTCEYLIINFLKDDFLTKEFKEKAKREFNDYNYRSIVIYRGVLKFALGACIVLIPIMWAMAFITN